MNMIKINALLILGELVNQSAIGGHRVLQMSHILASLDMTEDDFWAAISFLVPRELAGATSGPNGLVWATAEGVEYYETNQGHSGAVNKATLGTPNGAIMSTEAPDPRKVFVVHGRNKPARKALFDFLRSIGLQPLEWSQALAASGKGAPFIGEVLDRTYSQVRAVVVLLTGDDLAMLAPAFQEPDDPEPEKQLTPQARPNVLFEAGLALGRHPDSTILVQLGTLRPFSDIAGRHVVRLSNAPASRHDLVNRLKVAGCSVDLSGPDWLSTGDFDGSIPKFKSAPPSPVQKSTPPKSLHDNERAILEYFRQEENATGDSDSTARDVADALSLPISTVKHHLSELAERQLINVRHPVRGNPVHSLARKGRSLLIGAK